MKLLTRRKAFTGIAAALLAACCVGALRLSGVEVAAVTISEVCTGNVTVLADPEGQYRSYVELSNPSDTDVDLTGWYLSDSRKNPKKCRLEGIVVPAHGYELLWLVGENESDEGTSAQSGEETVQAEAALEMKSKGGTLILSDHTGHVQDAVRVPYLECNTSYSKRGEDWQVMECTPGEANEGTTEPLHILSSRKSR